jgi:hypothetical protein
LSLQGHEIRVFKDDQRNRPFLDDTFQKARRPSPLLSFAFVSAGFRHASPLFHRQPLQHRTPSRFPSAPLSTRHYIHPESTVKSWQNLTSFPGGLEVFLGVSPCACLLSSLVLVPVYCSDRCFSSLKRSLSHLNEDIPRVNHPNYYYY